MSWLNKIKNYPWLGNKSLPLEDLYLVVALGNPGSKYEGTRHNLGRDFLLNFREKNSVDFSSWQNQSKFEALMSEGVIDGEKAILFLPETFMNLSGRAVQKYLTFNKIKPTLIVIHDDVDLPLGKVKVSTDSGAGGHNGVSSIIASLGTKNFTRIRLGIGKSEVMPTDKFVLEKFTAEEQGQLPNIFTEAELVLKNQ